MSTSSQNPARTEYIAGLREFADWLERNPQVPAPTSDRMLLPLTTNPAVEEFAAEHGLTVEVDSHGNTSADFQFGPIVYHVYGYADFSEFCKQNNEKQARTWADRNGMVIQPRQGGGAAADRVVAYRNPDRPSVLLCREHGDGWAGLTPLTSEDLPDGGTCTYGRPSETECGRDVLINDSKLGGQS